MKIYTNNIDVEMTMEEFENILEKGMLDIMITIIASLSDKVGTQKPMSPEEELTSLLNDIFHEGEKDLEELLAGGKFCDKEECDDCGECQSDLSEDELDEIDEENETINRIYHNIFRNGER